VAASVGPYGAALADGSEYRGRYGLSVARLRRWHRPRLEVLAETLPRHPRPGDRAGHRRGRSAGRGRGRAGCARMAHLHRRRRADPGRTTTHRSLRRRAVLARHRWRWGSTAAPPTLFRPLWPSPARWTTKPWWSTRTAARTGTPCGAPGGDRHATRRNSPGAGPPKGPTSSAAAVEWVPPISLASPTCCSRSAQGDSGGVLGCQLRTQRGFDLDHLLAQHHAAFALGDRHRTSSPYMWKYRSGLPPSSTSTADHDRAQGPLWMSYTVVAPRSRRVSTSR
jgi:hypothetical protein